MSRQKDIVSSFKKNRGAMLGLVIIIFFVIIAILAPWLAPYTEDRINAQDLRIPPLETSAYLLGTDDVGRDVLSRLIYGTRVSVVIGLCIVGLSLLTGTTLGLLAGYFGGLLDRMIMRVVDLMMSLPSVLLAIVVVSILGPSLANTIIAVAIVAIPSFVRLVRASVMAEKSKDYVQAARSLGASHTRILLRNIFPNCLAPLIVQASLGFSDGILNAAALGFLGLGAQPPTAEWGTMLADSRPFIETSPWLVTLPGLCILIVVLGFNLMGDGLRDALDPKLKR